jgi:hypothetical protein
MKIILVAALASLAGTGALAADDAVTKARAELATACAQSYASYITHNPGSPNYAGEKQPGDTMRYPNAKACTEEQLAAYLDRADPVLVMSAYPTAAGRPKAKKPVTSSSAPK